MASSVLIRIKLGLLALLAGCLAGLPAGPALAVPPLPSSFFGTVKVNGRNVPDGTRVVALVGGKVSAEGRTQTYQGDSVYGLDVLGDDGSTRIVEGGKEGDAVRFQIAGVLADQIGEWHSGTNVQLNLTAKATGPLPTPEPPATPVPTETPRPVATLQQPTATPDNAASAKAPAQGEQVTVPALQQPVATSTGGTEPQPQPQPQPQPPPASTQPLPNDASAVTPSSTAEAPAAPIPGPAGASAPTEVASDQAPEAPAPATEPNAASDLTAAPLTAPSQADTQAALSTGQPAPTGDAPIVAQPTGAPNGAAPAGAGITASPAPGADGADDLGLLAGVAAMIVIAGGLVWLVLRRK